MTRRRSFGDIVEHCDDTEIERDKAPDLQSVWHARLSRRGFLRSSSAVGLVAAAGGFSLLAACDDAPEATTSQTSAAHKSRYSFEEISHGVDHTHHVAPGHEARILLRWGDPIHDDAPPFDPWQQSAGAQLKQFGYNNDFIGFIPLPIGTPVSDRGILCVNHEFTNDDLMFPGLGEADDIREILTQAQIDISMAAHGGTVIEIARGEDGTWAPVLASRYNRRISTLATPMRLSGPAAGSARLATGQDRTGREVTGTLNNCAGGITPWGTYLMAEENFHLYFMGETQGHPEQENFERYGVPAGIYAWGRFHDRFDINKEPNEANRFGWVVEVDPLAPEAKPVKRTALGRFKHEGAETIIAPDGRVVIYMGDDQRGEYLYKFVSRDAFDYGDRFANTDLLDNGTLYVARFEEEGRGTWLPLTYGEGPLGPQNGFHNQGDVVIEARRAADLLEATPMDRPEDVQPEPMSGRVYVALTNNSKRGPNEVNAANPRGPNLFGHILELVPDGLDHTADSFAWDFVVLCGPKGVSGSEWNEATSEDGWFSCPDNLAADPLGRLWVATDQGSGWSKLTGTADGLWALETQGPGRGTGRMFFRVPVGAELCGPRFTEDGRALFLSVQHPAASGEADYLPFARKSTFEDPATRWPDFAPGSPPRPSVVVISRDDGGVIG